MAKIAFYDIECWPNFFSNTILFENGDVQTCYIHKESSAYNGVDEMLDLYKKNEYWFTGYNNMFFDDRVIQWMLEYFDNRGKTYSIEGIVADIYNFAQDCINDNTKKYKWGNGISFKSIDLMRVGYLDKSLKMVATNLEWPLIQDLPYPHDHHVQEDEIGEILDYNLNDVEITKRLYEELERNIKLRGYMSKKYEINLVSDSDSSIANKLLSKLYSIRTGESYWNFKDVYTTYDSINLGSLVSDKINFTSDNLIGLVDKLNDSTIQKKENGKFESFSYHVRIGKTTYKIAKGGIHSENSYEIYESNNEHTYIELDWSSYYPILMIVLNAYPSHLRKEFIELFEEIIQERLSFKKDGKYVESDALKIVINSTYGKLGNKGKWLYDIAAMYRVTINGQLFMLMLIEKLKQIGISCCYANTDGAVFKVPNNRIDEFQTLYKDFEEYTGFIIDEERFSKMVIRDCNNYIWETEEGKIKRKGELNKYRHKGAWGIARSFDKPIVPEAIENYFFKGIPIKETIANEDNVMKFCMAQKAGKKFDVMRRYIEDGQIKEETIQRTNRYFVSDAKGDVIYKKNGDREISMGGVADEHILLYNKPNQYSRDRVKDQYYIKEARKITQDFESKQGELF